jgi:hypothetical protein
VQALEEQFGDYIISNHHRMKQLSLPSINEKKEKGKYFPTSTKISKH